MNSYSITSLILSPIFRRWVGKVEGVDNIPQGGGVIVALNHESYLDFLSFSAISPREIHFLAAEKFFNGGVWELLMKLTAQIKVDRISGKNTGAKNKAIELLENGKLLGIFPEGTRSRDGKLQRAFHGVAEIALQAKVPIVPVGISGTFEIWPKHKNFPIFKKCIINIGKPIYLNSLYRHEKTKALFEKITNQLLMHRIADLAGEKYHWSERKDLSFLEKEEIKKIVFFDVDNTLVEGQSQQLFIKYLYEKKMVSVFAYYFIYIAFILYKIGMLPKTDKIRNLGFGIIKGWDVEKTSVVLSHFFDEVLVHKIRPQAVGQINEHLNKGDDVILFSTSWKEILKPLQKFLNIPHLVATEIKTQYGKYEGEIKGIAPYGYNKVVIAQEFIHKKNFDIRSTIAYADHYSDKDLLNYVRIPVV